MQFLISSAFFLTFYAFGSVKISILFNPLCKFGAVGKWSTLSDFLLYSSILHVACTTIKEVWGFFALILRTAVNAPRRFVLFYTNFTVIKKLFFFKLKLLPPRHIYTLLYKLLPLSFFTAGCHLPVQAAFRIHTLTSNHARQVSDWCDIYKVVKVVYGNWSENYCNRSSQMHCHLC